MSGVARGSARVLKAVALTVVLLTTGACGAAGATTHATALTGEVPGVVDAARIATAPVDMSQAGAPSPAAVAPTPGAAKPARLVESIELSARLHELVIHSEALGAETRARILLPTSFGSSDKRYPVLYLLHGMNGDYTRWTTDLPTESTTADLDLIVIMPDGGPTGFYSNWYNGGAFGPPAWETYHLEELRLLLEQQFRANGRYAIAGHSMGGFGALSYASRHPDIFSAVIGSSPASDTRFLEPVTPAVLTAATALEGPEALWGDFTEDEVRWRAHNPLDLAPNLRQTAVYLSCHNGVPGPLDSLANPQLAQMTALEAALYAMNIGYSNRLDQLAISPAGRDLGRPGSHIIEYAHEALERWLPEVVEVLERVPVDLSRSFTYRSAEDRFSVWGWTFDIERPAPAFVDVTVSGDTVAVNGTGLVRIVTPAHYTPGRTYRIQVNGHDAVDAIADDLGRLSFELDLAGSSSETYTALYDQPGPRHEQQAVTATISSALPPADTPAAGGRGGGASAQGARDRATGLPATGLEAPGAALAALLTLAVAARVLLRTARGR